MSLLSDKIGRGEFVITSEIGPPKGTNVEHCLEDAEILRGRVAAINVTDLQSAVMRVGSLAVCRLLVDRGLEPVLQMVCRDRNRISLQSELLSATILGVENVLCLTGDHNTLGDHPTSKPVFDLDSVGLLQAATGLMAGKDMVGNALEGSPRFCLGAVVTPCGEPLDLQLIKMEKKIEAGARFFQTQAVYEPEVFETFMRKVESFRVPVLVGIVLLKSAGMAKFMNANVAGVKVPKPLIDRMAAASKDDRTRVSIEIAGDLIRRMKDMCQGVHIMPLGWDKYVPAVLDAAGM